ncbi:GD17668 [Drosophila simulans]|uniref:GD17668 n=1 Tax=Drosophila simulans TaxID=7240 RepID=B4NSV6_DROSI|nr:GD17668 [Drosophila simulans]
MGGRLWHQQSVTWTWPASMESEDAPEARVWEEAEAISWRTAGQESRDPRIHARADGAATTKAAEADVVPGSAATAAAPMPLQAGVSGRAAVEGGADRRLAAPGGRGRGSTKGAEAKSALGQVVRAWRSLEQNRQQHRMEGKRKLPIRRDTGAEDRRDHQFF